METIIDPVNVDLLKAELTPERKLCNTNKAGNEIYVFKAAEAPNLMQEVGRLREISFRREGGCSGLSADIDEFDTMETPYSQIIVWDPDASAIIGGYRYILGPDVHLTPEGQPILATSHMFKFSEGFIKDYLPHTMELGRSFVTPEYQSSKAGAKALFALDNLWDGITAVILANPQTMFLFGKMTMYPSYDPSARDLLLHFLWKHFPDPEELVRPFEPVEVIQDGRLLDLILHDQDFESDYRNLKSAIKSLGLNIPPLVNSYMNTSPTMKMLGAAVNHEFSEAIETAILVCFNEMTPAKRDRHMKAYIADKMLKMRKLIPGLSAEKEAEIVQQIFDLREKAFDSFTKKKMEKMISETNINTLGGNKLQIN